MLNQAKLIVANDISGSYTRDEVEMIIRILEKLKQSDISTLWITSDLDDCKQNFRQNCNNARRKKT